VPETLSAAVGVALATHPRGRYETAKAMADALDAAAQGIAPPTSLIPGATEEWDTAATSVLTSRTEATRAAPRSAPAAQRQPVPARRRAEPVAPAAAAPRERRKRRSPARAITLALIALLVIAGIVIAVVSSSGGNDQVRLHRVTYPTVGQSVDAMKQLVEDNTR